MLMSGSKVCVCVCVCVCHTGRDVAYQAYRARHSPPHAPLLLAATSHLVSPVGQRHVFFFVCVCVCMCTDSVCSIRVACGLCRVRNVCTTKRQRAQIVLSVGHFCRVMSIREDQVREATQLLTSEAQRVITEQGSSVDIVWGGVRDTHALAYTHTVPPLSHITPPLTHTRACTGGQWYAVVVLHGVSACHVCVCRI